MAPPCWLYPSLVHRRPGNHHKKCYIINITCVAFFFLIRSGEYCKGGTDTTQHPFSLKDFQFFIGQQPYNSTKASNPVLTLAYFAILLFITHKNGVKGESIGHIRTGHPQGCPVAAMCCRVEYL